MNIKKINIFTLYFLLLALLPTPVLTQSQWSEIEINNTFKINSLFNLNTSHIFLAANNGKSKKSTDSGDNWSNIDVSTSDNLTSIFFHNANKGFITSESGNLFSTSNGGSSWQSNNLHNASLSAIDFNDDLGIIVGNNGKILLSSDDGDTWQDIPDQTVFSLNDVKIVNDTLIVAVGANGSIIKSNDDGATWESMFSGTNEALSSVDYDQLNQSVLIVGNNGVYLKYSLTSGSLVLDNLGTDWLRQSYCIANSRCYVAGFNQRIFILGNNEEKERNIEDAVNLNAITFINDSVGFVGATNGKLFKTTTGGFLVSNQQIKSLFNIHTYPNPITDFLNIDIQNDDFTGVISSLNGEVVLSFTNTQRINVSHLASGYYLLSIRMNNKVYHQKLIKE